jgi:hypothetical protein
VKCRRWIVKTSKQLWHLIIGSCNVDGMHATLAYSYVLSHRVCWKCAPQRQYPDRRELLNINTPFRGVFALNGMFELPFVVYGLTGYGHYF